MHVKRLLFLSFIYILNLGAEPLMAPLPPELPWKGASENLLLPASDPWATRAETSNFVDSPSYDETFSWLQKLAAQAPELKLVSLGKSGEGRDIWMVIASKDKAFTPEEMKKSGNPIFIAQAGIHSGEIDGKDAGMMLLRDMTVKKTKSSLLDKAIFLFVPILNVDGHERSSIFGRINQRGPREIGWRTNAKNMNLNRDYAKLDTPEIRAIVGAINTYQPELYFDIHVTDGADYQYDITFAANGPHTSSPKINTWLHNQLFPFLTAELRKQGHIPGFVASDFVDGDPRKGVIYSTFSARFSDGYGDARHLPTVLIENHSLKPYKQRVLGTYVLLENALKFLAQKGSELKKAIRHDDARHSRETVLTWTSNPKAKKTVRFLGVESKREISSVTNTEYTQWTGKTYTADVPLTVEDQPKEKVKKPKSYFIPPQWGEIITRLRLHGVRMEVLPQAMEKMVDQYRLTQVKLATQPFEGHVPLEGVVPVMERTRRTLAAGTVKVSTQQPLGDLVVHLLEPSSPDSFLKWGFMHEVLQLTEYSEEYVTQPYMKLMFQQNPKLLKEFEAAKKASAEFAKSTPQQLAWFYERTPYYDREYLRYPIVREAD